MLKGNKRRILDKYCRGCDFYKPNDAFWDYKICLLYCVLCNPVETKEWTDTMKRMKLRKDLSFDEIK